MTTMTAAEAPRRTGRDLRLALEAAHNEPHHIPDDTLEADIADGLTHVFDEVADPWSAA